MAQPPEQNDTFVREVDENLRRDRMNDFVRDNAGKLIGAVVVFLVVCGALIFWRSYRERQSEAHVEQLAQVYAGIQNGRVQGAPEQLDQLSNSSGKAVRASALFGRAGLALQQGDTALALAKYKQIAADSGLPDSFRNLALIRQTAIEFDSLPPQQVVERLQPLAKAGEPWFGSAGELTAMALIKQGRKHEAGEMFAAIARDKTVPDNIRGRSIEIASTLGIDASDAMPARPAQ